MKIVDIPVVRGLPSAEEFHARYVAGGGRPVVFEGVMDCWPALETWSFERFRADFGEQLYDACFPQFAGPGALAPCSIRLTLGSYLTYLEDPAVEPLGQWLTGDWETLVRQGGSLYVGSFNPVAGEDPDAFTWPHARDIAFPLGSVEDWTARLPARFRKLCWEARNHLYVYLSTTGALTPLHKDFWHSHAYLAQIQGRKSCCLFSPVDTDNIYAGKIDPLAVDYECFPLAAQATVWIGELHPGQILFIPADWYHHVVTHEASITASYNWFDRENVLRYLSASVNAVAPDDVRDRLEEMLIAEMFAVGEGV